MSTAALDQKILDAVKSARSPITVEQVCKKIGATRFLVSRAMTALSSSGALAKVEDSDPIAFQVPSTSTVVEMTSGSTRKPRASKPANASTSMPLFNESSVVTPIKPEAAKSEVTPETLQDRKLAVLKTLVASARGKDDLFSILLQDSVLFPSEAVIDEVLASLVADKLIDVNRIIGKQIYAPLDLALEQFPQLTNVEASASPAVIETATQAPAVEQTAAVTQKRSGKRAAAKPEATPKVDGRKTRGGKGKSTQKGAQELATPPAVEPVAPAQAPAPVVVAAPDSVPEEQNDALNAAIRNVIDVALKDKFTALEQEIATLRNANQKTIESLAGDAENIAKGLEMALTSANSMMATLNSLRSQAAQ
ncbi:hypothetical protein ACYPKM_02905 [Pseudomonas aeruginosa]